jgi:hypothetical protein
MHCWPLVPPPLTPHWLLLIQYLPMRTVALAVQLLPTIAPPPQFKLLGSTQAPYRHFVLPLHAVPHAPQ